MVYKLVECFNTQNLQLRSATMAEWSKAADLSSVIRTNAWVRTPLVVFILSLQILSIVINLLTGMWREWCSWLSRQLYTLKVPGSSPGLRTFSCFKLFVRVRKKKIQPPRIELGTSRVLGERHNQLDHGCLSDNKTM